MGPLRPTLTDLDVAIKPGAVDEGWGRVCHETEALGLSRLRLSSRAPLQ